jgi:transposase
MSKKDAEVVVEKAAMVAVAHSEELPERWSARAKTEIVLRRLKGEDIGTVARETQVPVHELETWRRVFLEGGTQGLKRRDLPGAERELTRAQAKVGELTMKLAVVERLLEKKKVRGGAAEVEAFQGRVSPGTGRPYPVTLLCAAMRAPRSSVYAAAGRRAGGQREARAEDGAAGRCLGRRDPRGAIGVLLPQRGASEGPRAAPRPGHPRGAQARAAPDCGFRQS